MKKWIYLLMIFGLFILGGCNLFSGLDEEDLDGSSFDYKLEESMASGDYGTVISLVTNKIASTPELKIIDDELKEYEPDWETATTTQLKDYYDELIILEPYSNIEKIQTELNLDLSNISKNQIYHSDFINLVVFLKKNKSIKISELDRNIGDFTDYKVLIKRENAYFYKNDQQKIELKK